MSLSELNPVMCEASNRCVQCDRIVTRQQEAIQCDLCHYWTHRLCGTGIVRAIYQNMLEKHNQDGVFGWKCDVCKCKLQELLLASTGNDGSDNATPPSPPPAPPLSENVTLSTSNVTWFNTESQHFAPIRLHFAINSGQLNLVEQLIASGTDINFAAPINGCTPLLLSITVQRFDIASALIAAGADVTIAEATPWHRHAIHLAAAAGAIDIVSSILDRSPCSTNVVDSMLFTPLHHAVIAGHLPVIQLLIGAGARVDARDDRGRTALFRAVEQCHSEFDIIDVLLAAGANIDVVDIFGWTPLYHAALCGQCQMVRCLLNCGASVLCPNTGSALHAACGGATHRVFNKLREAGVDFYMRRRRSTTAAVHQAVSFALQSGDNVLELVTVLVDFGADVNQVDADNNTPVHYAILLGRSSIVQLLLSAGADISNRYSILEQQWPESVTQGPVWKWLCHLASSRVRPLLDLCRLTVRHSVRTPTSRHILELPLPEPLLRLLQLNY